MGLQTGISWTDSTFNPWIGCTKVSPGCDHCYAEMQDSRKRWGGETHWGAGVPRHRTSASTWKNPVVWNQAAAGTHRVFCASLADVFDNEVPEAWREDLFRLIERTPKLTWQLLTKRIGNVPDMAPTSWQHGFPANVWIGMTAVTQAELDRDIGKLTYLPARVRWLSIEPQLEEIRIPAGVRWVVTGGESGRGARPYDVAWARSIVRQCRAIGVAPFVKQLGANVVWNGIARGGNETWPIPTNREDIRGAWRIHLKNPAGKDPAEWPADLRVQEFPC